MDSTVHLVVSKPPDSYLGGPPRIQKCRSPSHILHIFCLFFAIFFTSSSGMRKIFWGRYNTINVLKSASESWEMNDNISVGSEKIDFFGCWGRWGAPPPTPHHCMNVAQSTKFAAFAISISASTKSESISNILWKINSPSFFGVGQCIVFGSPEP